MRGLATILLLFALQAPAQEPPPTTQQQIENLGDENLEDDALLQTLDFYRKHPLDLNTATADDLKLFFFLNDLQINALLRHRTLFGKLIDLYELQAVPGFDLLTIRKLRPYVVIGPAVGVKQGLTSRFNGGDQYILSRWSRVLEKAKGYDTARGNRYLGDGNRLLIRYRYQHKNDLYYGVVAEKDAGEQFFKGGQKSGFDFYSVHFFARNLGKLKAIALGDYVVNLGQGLTQWQSLGFGKSADILHIKRQAPVLLPYRSAGEFYFNRGAAATLDLGRWEATAFVSYKGFSGNLDADSVERFTSFGTSGYHRTPTEVADRKGLKDFSAGGNFSYHTQSFKAGINAVGHQFSRPLQKRDAPYNYFALNGKQALNTSFDYSYTYHNMHLFGEAAMDKGGNTAFVQGLLVSADPKVDLSFLYRRLSPGYMSLFGNAFSENTLPSNENGFYAGIVVRPFTGWQLAAYADHYRFPFLKYRVNAPTRGRDYLAQLTFLPNKQTQVYLRYRTENKPINPSGSVAVTNYPLPVNRQNLRLHYSTQLSPAIALQARTEAVWYDKTGAAAEEGFLTFVEVDYEHPLRIRSSFRLQYFETGGYNSRIYAYETDVLYGYSVPAFFDKGIRYYATFRYDATAKFSFWLRWAQTVYANRQTVGSGLDETQGAKRTELKLQARYGF